MVYSLPRRNFFTTNFYLMNIFNHSFFPNYGITCVKFVMMFLVWLPFCTYTSAVRPYLGYASMVWNLYTSSDINLLEAVQNQTALDSCHLGSCLGSKSSHTCLSGMKWPSLEPISLLIISIACYVI